MKKFIKASTNKDKDIIGQASNVIHHLNDLIHKLAFGGNNNLQETAFENATNYFKVLNQNFISNIPDNESALIKRNQEVTDEREVLIKAFADITKEFKGRDWITDGRGPYSFDDEGYRKEVSYLFDAFKKIERQVWSNIKSKTFEYKNQIQEPLIKRNEELEAMLEDYQRCRNYKDDEWKKAIDGFRNLDEKITELLKNK